MIRKRLFEIPAAVAILAGLAVAQVYPARQGDMAVSIPFEFEIEGQKMPAGEYIIQRDTEWDVLRVCEDGVYCAVVQFRDAKGLPKETAPRLIFRKQAGRMVLAAVDCGAGKGYRLPKCPDAILRGEEGLECEIECLKARYLTLHVFPGLAPAWS